MILIQSLIHKALLLLIFKRVVLWRKWWIHLKLIVYYDILIFNNPIFNKVLLVLIWCAKCSILPKRVLVFLFLASRIVNARLSRKISFINKFICLFKLILTHLLWHIFRILNFSFFLLYLRIALNSHAVSMLTCFDFQLVVW